MTELSKAEQKLKEKLIDSLHWQNYTFIGQGNAIFEGCLTQASKETIADQIHSIYKASGYFQEEAEWVGHLLKKGWIPPEEAAGYVKMEKDQDLLASSATTILDVKGSGWVKGEQKGKNEKTH